MNQEEMPEAGEIVNDSFSSNAPKIRLRPLRLALLDPTPRFLLQIAVAMLFCSSCLGGLGLYLIRRPVQDGLTILGWLAAVASVLPALALLASLFFAAWYVRRMATIFREALLTPAVVISSDPLACVVMANMNTGFGPDTYAVARLEPERLPCYPTAVGTRFPCVSYFQPGLRQEVWASFESLPLCYGTGDSAVLADRERRIGEEAFARLEACIRAGEIPPRTRKIRFIGETG